MVLPRSALTPPVTARMSAGLGVPSTTPSVSRLARAPRAASISQSHSYGFPMALALGLRAAGHSVRATRLSRRTGRPDSRATCPNLRAVSQAR